MKRETKGFKDFLSADYDSLESRALKFYDFIQERKNLKHHFYKRVALDGSGPIREVLDPDTSETRKMIYLASNDYLNLTQHPKVIKAATSALNEYGAGAGSVPLLGGTNDLHINLEKKIAAFKGTEDAVIYTSGFGGNVGTLLSLLGNDDAAVLDLLVHASIIEGCKNTKVRYFKHNDVDHLETVLQSLRNKCKTILVAIDGVYSMNGDIAPLDQIYKVCQRYGALIYVDDAHASGVIGENGRGTAEHFGLEGKIDFIAGTFSKAFGGVGGYIATTKEFATLLTFFSKPYMYSTAMPPSITASMIAAIDVIMDEPEVREKLMQNINYFSEGLKRRGIHFKKTDSAIFPIVLGEDYLVNEATRILHENDIYVNPVVYPAVPLKESRMRISLMSAHSEKQLEFVLNKLVDVFDELRIERKIDVINKTL